MRANPLSHTTNNATILWRNLLKRILLLNKIHRDILPHQQYRFVIGIHMVITGAAAAAIDPAAIFYNDMACGIAIDSKGIGGIRQIAQAFCGQRQRVIALAEQTKGFNAADVTAEIRQIEIQAVTGKMQHRCPCRQQPIRNRDQSR